MTLMSCDSICCMRGEAWGPQQSLTDYAVDYHHHEFIEQNDRSATYMREYM